MSGTPPPPLPPPHPTPFYIYVTPLSGLLNDYMPLLGALLHYLLVSVGGLGWGNPAEEVKEGSGPQKKGGGGHREENGGVYSKG